MIKLSVNESKWSSLPASTRALILYSLLFFFSIWIFDFEPEKLPGLPRNGPLARLSRPAGSSAFLGLYPSSLSKSAEFASLAAKASLVSISNAILSYFNDPSMFIYRRRSNFVGKKMCWKGSMAAEMPSRASYLMYYIVSYEEWIWPNYYENSLEH